MQQLAKCTYQVLRGKQEHLNLILELKVRACSAVHFHTLYVFIYHSTLSLYMPHQYSSYLNEVLSTQLQQAEASL